MKTISQQFHKTALYFKLCCLLTALFGAINAMALEPKWPKETFSVTVQEKPLQEFLKDLFAFSGVTAVFSDQVQGRVSGQFTETADKTFNDIVRAYGLLPYYDGSVMHISTMAEVQSKSIHTDPGMIDKVLQQIVKLDLTDARQSIQIVRKSGLIKARGSAQFVLDIEELVESINRSYKKPKDNVMLASKVSKPSTYRKSGEVVFQTFQLQYASAADVIYYQNEKEIVIPGVATLLRNMVGESRPFSTNPLPAYQQYDHTLPGLKGQGLNRRYQSQHTQTGDVQLTGYTQPAVIGSGIYPDYTANVSARQVNGESIVRIEAERNLNAVIVRDYADAMPVYADLIRQLDQEPQLVEIQVTIIDIDKNKLLDLGLDWRYEGTNTSARFGGGDLLDNDGSAGGLLLNTVLGDAGRFIANIRALAEAGSARVVSRPQVLTLSNLEAVLRSDESFFIRVAGAEEVDLFNVSAGTTLRVIPQVVGHSVNPQIRLMVTIEDGSIVPEASVDDIPIIENSSLNTQAIIYNGENLLLGGLVRETSRKNASKVPLLGDIPAVGNLFKRTVTTDTRTERLFLISPRIVSSHRTLVSSAGSASERTLLSSISPEYNNASFYNEQDEYVRGSNEVYKTIKTEQKSNYSSSGYGTNK